MHTRCAFGIPTTALRDSHRLCGELNLFPLTNDLEVLDIETNVDAHHLLSLGKNGNDWMVCCLRDFRGCTAAHGCDLRCFVDLERMNEG